MDSFPASKRSRLNVKPPLRRNFRPFFHIIRHASDISPKLRELNGLSLEKITEDKHFTS